MIRKGNINVKREMSHGGKEDYMRGLDILAKIIYVLDIKKRGT